MKPFEFVASELKDDLLDHFVAVAMGWKVVMWGDRQVWVRADGEGRFCSNVSTWHPSTNPAQAWPIIESERISSIHVEENDPYPIEDGPWSCACPDAEIGYTGPTLLIAAMRCFVASKLGEKFIVSTL